MTQLILIQANFLQLKQCWLEEHIMVFSSAFAPDV